jgi:hypothetical protein
MIGRPGSHLAPEHHRTLLSVTLGSWPYPDADESLSAELHEKVVASLRERLDPKHWRARPAEHRMHAAGPASDTAEEKPECWLVRVEVTMCSTPDGEVACRCELYECKDSSWYWLCEPIG